MLIKHAWQLNEQQQHAPSTKYKSNLRSLRLHKSVFATHMKMARLPVRTTKMYLEEHIACANSSRVRVQGTIELVALHACCTAQRFRSSALMKDACQHMSIKVEIVCRAWTSLQGCSIQSYRTDCMSKPRAPRGRPGTWFELVPALEGPGQRPSSPAKLKRCRLADQVRVCEQSC